MNLVQNIHALWNASLQGFVPTDRVFTGRAPRNIEAPPPYASIRTTTLRPNDKSNTSNYDIKTLVISAWFESDQQAKAFGAALLLAYRDIDFDLETGSESLNLSLATQNELEEDDPTVKRHQSITEFNVNLRSNRP